MSRRPTDSTRHDAQARKRVLVPHQQRALREYEHLLEVVGLNPERVIGLAENDPSGVIPTLKSMTDQIVRSEVIFEYTMIDMELDHLLYKHFFGSGKRLLQARSTVRYRTLRQMLQNLYPLQKLAIVRTFRTVPRGIASKIASVNELRNGVAHTFFMDDLPVSKRTYKGVSIFKRKGLEAFRDDAWEIRCFFMPWLTDWVRGEQNEPHNANEFAPRDKVSDERSHERVDDGADEPD